MNRIQIGNFEFLRRCALWFLLCLSFETLAAPISEDWPMWQSSNEESSETVSHELWQGVLGNYVRETESGLNLFAYADVSSEDQAALTRYLHDLQSIDPRGFSRNEQFAYWVNFYNALTVNLILDDYPVTSITKLGQGFFKFGPWDDVVAIVAGEELTLNDIEHRILRPIWNDLRIHFAVNCASIGCPNLQSTAYAADNIEELLDASAAAYLSHSRGLSFSSDGSLKLSSIFDWYAVDFGRTENEVLDTLAEFLPAEQGQRLRSYNGKIEYDYNWALNEYSGETD